MKFLFSSDFHGHEPAFRAYAAALAEGPFDAGILAGDLLDEWIPHGETSLVEALERRRDQLRALLEAAGKPLYFVLGNHDVTPWPDTALMTNLHLKAVTAGDCRLAGYRWTRMDRYPHELEADWAELEPLVDEHTVLVTHSPPWGVLDGEPGSRFLYGLKGLHRLKPRLHLFGHVHETPGVLGRCVNGAYPALRRFFVVDTASGEVTLW